MSGNDKHPLVPRLRFPEFRDAGAWERKELNEFVFEYQQRNRDLKYGPQDVLSVSGEYGCVNQIEHLGRSYAGASVKEYRVVDTGDIVYTKSPLKKNPFGIIKENKGRPGIVSTLYAVYRTKENAHPAYFDHYFSRDYFLNSYLQPLVKKGAKNDLKVNNAVVLSGSVVAPQKNEQIKIADCLFSIDDLIMVENQKLDALKSHKDGLLQQLFPRGVETVPRLRFPDFRDAGKWEEKTLGQLGELVSGLTYSPNDVREGGLLVLRSSNVQDGRIVLDDNVYVKTGINGANLSKPNDILICVRNGSKSLIGKSALIPEGMPLCTHGAFMTVFRSSSAKFIIQLFQTAAYEKQVAADLGATINSINGNQLKKYTFLVPKSGEQEVIADFLASLDDLITAQSQKIVALKTHKMSLMQQLFPIECEEGQ